MRRLFLSTLAVLAVCLALCFISHDALQRTLDEAHDMTISIFTDMEKGRIVSAREALTALAVYWKEKSAWMELICDHDDLHHVKELIIQAKICIDYTDMEEFYSAVALIGEGIEHIREAEMMSVRNLL